MVGAAECAEQLEYGGPPAGPGRVGLHLVNASGKECYRKREGRRYTGPAHSAVPVAPHPLVCCYLQWMVLFGGSEFEFWRPRWPNPKKTMQMLLLEMPCGQKCSRITFWRSNMLCNGYVGSPGLPNGIFPWFLQSNFDV